jgi:hypothetical protein
VRGRITAVGAGVVIIAVVALGMRARPTDHETAADSPTTNDEAGSVSSTDTVEQLDTLTVAEWPEMLPVYERSDYRQWSDLDEDGCDTRREILAHQSVIDTTCQDPDGGRWWSPYDDQWHDDPGDVEIDHIVALSAAHHAGAWSFGPEQKEEFANDQDNLIAVTGAANRSKGAKTVELWRPENDEAECWMATRVVSVKAKWNLSVTHGEHEALVEMLAGCRDHSAVLAEITPPSDS